MTYQFLHYLIGLRRLGWDPYYVEDSARWLLSCSPSATWTTCSPRWTLFESDYAGHCRAAPEIAAEYFAAERVVASFMERAGLD